MIGGIGIQEILIILVVGLLVFGAARLPKIARSLGLGIKEFKKTIKGLEEDEITTEKISYTTNQPQGYQQQQQNMQQPGPGQYYGPYQQQYQPNQQPQQQSQPYQQQGPSYQQPQQPPNTNYQTPPDPGQQRAKTENPADDEKQGKV